MKTSRTRRQGGIKLPSSQSKIPAGKPETAQQKERREQKEWDESIAKEFALPADDEYHGACLAIFDRNMMSPVSKIPLSEADFTSVLFKNFHAGAAQDFFANAIREKLHAPEDDGLAELGLAITKANALFQLLSDKFDHLSRLDGCEFSGAAVNDFCGGVELLIIDVKNNLKKTFESAFHATYQTRSEVAS